MGLWSRWGVRVRVRDGVRVGVGIRVRVKVRVEVRVGVRFRVGVGVTVGVGVGVRVRVRVKVRDSNQMAVTPQSHRNHIAISHLLELGEQRRVRSLQQADRPAAREVATARLNVTA